MTRATRVAVIGCGHFGRRHAQKWAALPDADLVAVCDLDVGRAQLAARTSGGVAGTDFRRLIGRIEAASVAVPTGGHFAVAAALLEAGIHCLVEKPIAATVEQGMALDALARAQGLVLQVGHLERFNPALGAVSELIREPLFIEGTRLAPFQERGTDVDVVLDLMIHDLDLVHTLVPGTLERLDCVGVPVLSAMDDIVNARLAFARGCIVNLTASRVSLKHERRLRLFQRDGYIAVDLRERAVTVARKGRDGIELQQRSHPEGDPLRLQIEAFLRSIRRGAPVAVTAGQAIRALETATLIGRTLRRPPPR
ncbi:MAG TPA: Gfo/Idh/MocA family oxidoreductase [Geminicoccaceae bacterium]|nr:Gfo/Idh/MocA family oxidoreductase [Geminicoccaceae bacterium]